MADKKNDKLNLAEDAAPVKPAKDEKPKKDKKPFFLVRFWRAVTRWFKELKSEAKKVTWPSFKQVCKSTLVVVAVTVVVGGLVMLADVVFRNGLSLVISLF
ncbi:MAG: preprotein translocase subunit SecE [Clostridiales bacterium]|nr:preprotein translocase subunit SecE [Clostridiales bacterium]